MTELESRQFLASSLRLVAEHVEAMPGQPSTPLCVSIPGDFRLEAVSQSRGCHVSVRIGEGSADVRVSTNDPEAEPGRQA